MSILDDIKLSYRSGNIVVRFIFINVGIFLFVNLLLLLAVLFQTSIFNPIPWLAASSSLEETIYRPWTIISYMFLHEGFWHLFWNMIMLYFGGRLFADLLGDKRFIGTYIFGGISGLFLYMIAFSLVPAFQVNGGIGVPILGASASVLAILVAIATYSPEMRVNLMLIGPVKLKYIAIFFVVMDFIQIRSGQNTGGHIAHIGGALYGFFAARALANGNDWSRFLFMVTDYFAGWFKRKPKMKVASKNPGKSKARPAAKTDEKHQKRIDDILDKISQSGYESLSKEEKEYLFKASKN